LHFRPKALNFLFAEHRKFKVILSHSAYVLNHKWVGRFTGRQQRLVGHIVTRKVRKQHE
jgi:hypothetical protein